MEATEASSGRKPAQRKMSGSRQRPRGKGDDGGGSESKMAVSIAGHSTACSKDALVSSAEAVRKRLSTE
jgi:hypothetical protein